MLLQIFNIKHKKNSCSKLTSYVTVDLLHSFTRRSPNHLPGIFLKLKQNGTCIRIIINTAS